MKGEKAWSGKRSPRPLIDNQCTNEYGQIGREWNPLGSQVGGSALSFVALILETWAPNSRFFFPVVRQKNLILGGKDSRDFGICRPRKEVLVPWSLCFSFLFPRQLELELELELEILGYRKHRRQQTLFHGVHPDRVVLWKRKRQVPFPHCRRKPLESFEISASGSLQPKPLKVLLAWEVETMTSVIDL